MSFGPLEFAAYLRRRGTPERESAAVEAARASVVAPRPGENRLTVISGSRGLTRTSHDEVVSVFEAIVTRTATLPRIGKPVRVCVSETRLPMVLVLSSHQPVCWRLERKPGVRLLAVLLAGFGESRVSGAGDSVITSIGGFYAFKRDSGEFRHLENEVMRATGCAIGKFESALAAGEFQISGK
jgi:hypothetical protein